MNLEGTQTELNLYKTFAGESRAFTLYTLFAEIARREGYQWIGELFDDTAHNELAHARVVSANFLKILGDTKQNLVGAIKGEVGEFRDIYKQDEEEAREEGFTEIADFYKELREVEESHAMEYKEVYDKLEDGTIFEGPVGSKWYCMNCGYIYEGTKVPAVCPLCKFPRGYFAPVCDITNA